MTQPQAVIRVGQARLTAGLDRYARLDLAAHREVFGLAPQLSAAELIAMCEQVDLRGRGGAAFPVARKLRSVLARKRRPVIVVNGTEGEPGSAKDTTLLARSPYLVLDGAMLAAVLPHTARQFKITKSPGATPVTSGPTASTRPAASCPSR